MIRLSLLALSVILVLAVSPSRGQAAIVTFSGSLNSGNGPTLGAIPPSRDFSITLDFSQTIPGFGRINSGLFNSSTAMISVTGGDIIVTEGGANDQALFAIDTNSPTGSFSVTFTGNAITNNLVTTENLTRLITASAPSTISANFGAADSYTGTVTSAVPEPNSAMLLLGLAGFGSLHRRRRNLS